MLCRLAVTRLPDRPTSPNPSQTVLHTGDQLFKPMTLGNHSHSNHNNGPALEDNWSTYYNSSWLWQSQVKTSTAVLQHWIATDPQGLTATVTLGNKKSLAHSLPLSAGFVLFLSLYSTCWLDHCVHAPLFPIYSNSFLLLSLFTSFCLLWAYFILYSQ